MFKINLLKDYYKTGKVDGIILAIIIGIIFFNFITYEHFPHHDEVTSITLLSSIKTSFIKFYGHNHLISTQIGNLIIFFQISLVTDIFEHLNFLPKYDECKGT